MSIKKQMALHVSMMVMLPGSLLCMYRTHASRSLGAAATGVLGAPQASQLPSMPQSTVSLDTLRQVTREQATQPWTDQQKYAGGLFKTTQINRYGHKSYEKWHDFSLDLVHAVEQGRIHELRQLLSQGANVNQEGCFLLNIAVRAGDREMVSALITAGADVNAPDGNGITPLLMAIKMNNLEALRALISARARIDLQDVDGNTPLMIAALNGKTSIVRALIAAHANTTLRNNAGQTALQLATKYGHTQSVELLTNAALHSETEEKSKMDLFLSWLGRKI